MKNIAVLLALTAGVAGQPLFLRDGWAIQSSDEVHEKGDAVSVPGYKTRDWYRATLPATVLSALIQNHVYSDPYTGMNLRSIAGTEYPIPMNYSNIPMPPDSPFRYSWWYRTEFKLPAEDRGKTLWLNFDGINFRANVWMNGKQVAPATDMKGAWRLFNFDVTNVARAGETNSLAIEVFPPTPHDLAITFVDWNPMPADKGMGIWRDVSITTTGPVRLRFPNVTTKLDQGTAMLTVSAEVTNASGHAVEGVLKGSIESLEFSQPVKLKPKETTVVSIPQLKLENPRLWWPLHAGAQELYPLNLQFVVKNQVSDAASIRFGVREVTARLDEKGHLLFQINGKNILIRGAGYTFDLLLRTSPERQEAELQYVRDMNLNAVRFEGKLEDDHFLELCDQYGILVMAGWCCCDHWEHWADWDDEDEEVAAASMRDQARRLERHPAVFDWLYGSDNPPPPKIEKMYLQVLQECNWPNPHQSSATGRPTEVTGPSGVKMLGPYDYVAPSYWYLDSSHGGAYGFNTETGPGPSPPPIETLKRMLPAEHLWPPDTWWEYHAGGGPFHDLKVFTDALNARYGAASSVEEYARKSQMMAYESHRAMFEAFGRNKYTSTGVIQWMLNNSWPSMIWHLYDWYLRPGGSYFGAKKACEPLHVQYSYDDRSIVIVNSFYKPVADLNVTANVYNLDMSSKFSKSMKVGVDPDSSTRVFTLPDIDGLSSTYFVNLTLSQADGTVASRNFYWLSTSPETLDWEKSTWYLTPTQSYANFQALNTLPATQVSVTQQDATGSTVVTVTNSGKSLAFGVHLKLSKGNDEVLPILWEDNYFALLPGETRKITATYNPKDAGVRTPVVQVEAWNVAARVPLESMK